MSFEAFVYVLWQRWAATIGRRCSSEFEQVLDHQTRVAEWRSAHHDGLCNHFVLGLITTAGKTASKQDVTTGTAWSAQFLLLLHGPEGMAATRGCAPTAGHEHWMAPSLTHR